MHDVAMRDESASPLVTNELLEQLGDAVTVIDFDWRYLYVSQRAATIIGRRAEDVVGAAVWEIFAEVVGTPEHAAAVRAMNERTAVRIVWFFDQVGRWYEQHAIPTPQGLVIVVDDVTEREEDARRAERLLAVGNALAQAMSVGDVAAVTREQVLPLLGAVGGALVLVDAPHGVARTAEWVGLDPSLARRWKESSLSETSPCTDAYHVAGPIVLDDLAAARKRYPHLVHESSPVGRHTVAAFPLVSASTPLGALVAHFDHRCLTARDQHLMATIAAMCAQAVTRARLFDAERRSVEALQRHLLPQCLPEITDVDIAVRYQSSDSTVDIGGDWFDVVPLPGGAVGLVIGDVEGHDVEAAALMGLIRSAVRAYALEGHPPAFILERANQYLNGLDAQRLVTVSYLQLNATEHLAIVSSAGHLPTFVTTADGDVKELTGEVGPPLGAVEATLCWPETTSTVPADALLVAFTDGLVERRGADVGAGLDRVRATLAAVHAETTQDVATALVASRPPENDDDIAVLVARVCAGAVDPARRQVTRRLPPTPASVFVSRRFAAQVMRLWSVPEETSASVELVVSELATNAARHSEDTIEVRLFRSGSSVRVSVGDSSHRMPHLYDADEEMTSGRGLFLVEAVSDRWGVDSDGLGKSVWCEFDLHAGVA